MSTPRDALPDELREQVGRQAFGASRPGAMGLEQLQRVCPRRHIEMDGTRVEFIRTNSSSPRR